MTSTRGAMVLPPSWDTCFNHNLPVHRSGRPHSRRHYCRAQTRPHGLPSQAPPSFTIDANAAPVSREFPTVDRGHHSLENGETMLDGELDQARNVADLELLHQPAAIGLDGLRRQRQHLRDLRAGTAFDDQLQDFPLALAEALQRAGGVALADIVVDRRGGYPPAQVAHAGLHR